MGQGRLTVDSRVADDILCERCKTTFPARDIRMKTCRADFLFATPSPLAGIARFFDFAGTYDAYNLSENESEADAKAVFVDWNCVGDEVRIALNSLPLDKVR